jgi:hypothetical protein
MNNSIIDFKNFIKKQTGKAVTIKWLCSNDYAFFYKRLYIKKNLQLSDEDIVEILKKSPEAEKYGFHLNVMVFTDNTAYATLHIPKDRDDAEENWINGPKFSVSARVPRVKTIKSNFIFSLIKYFE